MTRGRTVSNDEPIAILCYGDSNTWGYDAATGERFGRWERWPGVLQRTLGDGFHVVEEGLGGRTTMFDVPGEPDRNGLTPFAMVLESHSPLDLVVIALGVNDIFLPGIGARWAARGAATLVDRVRSSGAGREGAAPSILVVVPPPIPALPPGDEAAAPAAREESGGFASEYAAVCEVLGVPMLDLGGVCEPTPTDGIHFERGAHEAIGLAVAGRVRSRLDGR
jgi:lysophospholipase L1-like esterase